MSSEWKVFEVLLSIAGITMQVVMWGIFLYYFTISVFGWFRRKETAAEKYAPVSRFAVLVAAHNEEAVIGSIVRNLKSLNYPKSLYDIFVIADNCDDNTAQIARELGARVYERSDTVKRGKGYSLEWMFKKLFELKEKFDAVCILDADNLVSPNFLMEMNKHLCMGHKVVQGYLDSKNPNDSWISGNNSIAFWIGNRMFQLPRYYLGLNCVLGGTGFIVATDVLKEIGWGATCLTEDLEFTLKLVLKNMKVYWAHDAVIYDEKPLAMPQSWRQRKRWMQGHFDCLRRFLKNLLVKAFKEKDMVAFDSAMYMFQPFIVVANGVGMVAGVLGLVISTLIKGRMDTGTICFTVVMIAFLYLGAIFMLLEKKFTTGRVIRYFLSLPLYNLTWVPIIVQGFMDRDRREWVHTLHTRAVDINEIKSLGSAG